MNKPNTMAKKAKPEALVSQNIVNDMANPDEKDLWRKEGKLKAEEYTVGGVDYWLVRYTLEGACVNEPMGGEKHK